MCHMICSITQPPEATEDTIGQVEGDIWYKIDNVTDEEIQTTPYQKQADGTYKKMTVHPIDQEIVHSTIVKNILKVDALPENPDPNTLYLVP